MNSQDHLEALPCPFCGRAPEVIPTDPEHEGNAWGAVQCVYTKCPTYNVNLCNGVTVLDGEDVADERGSEEYKAAAIRRWNGWRDDKEA